MDQSVRRPKDEDEDEDDDDDDQYEYEYHDSDFETFLVDVDLSSLNSARKPNVPGAPKPVVPAKRTHAQSTSTPQPVEQDAPSPSNVVDSPEEAPAAKEGGGRAPRNDADDEDGVTPFPSNVQILDLNTTNPIVSYMDHVYSCTWADMVGTNMFFTHPGMSNPARTLRSTEDYDLIGMSRIKLVGHEAKLAKKARSKQDTDADDVDLVDDEPQADDTEVRDGRSLGGISRSNPKTNAQIKQQASFLEKLMDVKRQRGETDVVRTFVDEKIASGDSARLHGARHAEMEDLNRKVVKGDAGALARLQEIYSQLDDNDNGADAGAQENAATPSVGD